MGRHAACMGGRHTGLWWESQKGKYQWEDLDVGGRILVSQSVPLVEADVYPPDQWRCPKICY
jgi:hypothetical protein